MRIGINSGETVEASAEHPKGEAAAAAEQIDECGAVDHVVRLIRAGPRLRDCGRSSQRLVMIIINA